MAIVERISSDKTWEQMLKRNSQDNLLLLCQRLMAEELWKESLMELSAFLEQYLGQHPEKLILLLSQCDIDLLFQIWNIGKKLDLSYTDQRNIVSLEKLGLIQYDHKEKRITINEDARANFYFYLKSRSSMKQIQHLQELEYAVKGILYQCGIIEFPHLCDILEEGGEEISSHFMHEFLVGRMEFWSFLGVLKNTKTEMCYLESYEVKNRNRIFEGWFEDQSRAFHRISMEDARLIGRMNGIGNWKGTKEMLSFCLTKIYKEVIPATVLVKTILIYIQNGDTMEELRNKLQLKIADFTEEEKLEFWKCIDEMYWHTPLFHLKGYSRWEDRKEKQHFSVIHGGKRD